MSFFKMKKDTDKKQIVDSNAKIQSKITEGIDAHIVSHTKDAETEKLVIELKENLSILYKKRNKKVLNM